MRDLRASSPFPSLENRIKLVGDKLFVIDIMSVECRWVRLGEIDVSVRSVSTSLEFSFEFPIVAIVLFQGDGKVWIDGECEFPFSRCARAFQHKGRHANPAPS